MEGASRQHPGLLWPMLHLFWRYGEQVRLVGAGRLQGSGVASLFHPARRRERAHGRPVRPDGLQRKGDMLGI
jgi:hypothetical protein